MTAGTVQRLFHEIRRRMAFKGSMRTHLVQMLNKIGVAERLGLAASEDLFSNASHELHSTSALRYPVFVNERNYAAPRRSDDRRS